MPFLIIVVLLGLLIGVVYYNNNKKRFSLPSQPIDEKLNSLLKIQDEPIVLAALLSLASLSNNNTDDEVNNLIENDILAQLTDKENAHSSFIVAENIYCKLNDRLFVLDEASTLLNKQISTKDRHHLFVLISNVHKNLKNENNITFYIKRLEKKLILNDANIGN